MSAPMSRRSTPWWGLVRALAIEVAAKGVTVNAVCPGYVDTGLVDASLEAIAARTGKGREEALSAMLKDNPQKRLIRPEEVAAACLWLASDAAAAVNGAAVPISGEGDVMDDHAPPIDRETAARLRPADHKAELRLWLRLLTCATLIESGVRSVCAPSSTSLCPAST